ncbi:MAG: phage holin family protein [Gelidibacter sp.]|uniref:phage holin family protein n=1 Tax=Gelidibacter sp. TaxID=2018083 RepID=UPI003264548F
MSIFESINNTSNKATDIGERYIDKSFEYFKLKIFQQLTYTISMIGKALIIGAVLFIGLILLSVSAAIAIGDALQNVALGYLIMGGVFMIIGLIIYKVRYVVDAKIIEKIQIKFFKS